MSDQHTTVSELREIVQQFVAARNWETFHSPKNLAMSIAIEAAELMEHFQWRTIPESREVVTDPATLNEITEEVADVLSYTLAIANALNLDLSTALRNKMVKNAIKYPEGGTSF
ncbi:MAG: nucleotide pyrophosphohydrolase [Planctomycetales bacterium]|nr:nucleotide pyrophosphohydrolase [Planctomycetales bacterium]MCA9169769.1 nucleotide pyrophosphohydrolase [Planctomycetales bacterium]